MAFLVDDFRCILLDVVQLNPDISPEKYQWRYEKIGREGHLNLLGDEEGNRQIYVEQGAGYYRTGVGEVEVTEESDGKIMSLKSQNSLWIFKEIKQKNLN